MPSVADALKQGWNLHQRKRYSEAEQIYRQVLRAAPNNPNAWCYLGIVLHDRRQYRQAVEAYQKALHLRPEFPVALNNLGNTLRYTGEHQEADAAFQQAIDLKPDYVNAFKNRGTLHVWIGNLDLGLRYYQQALKLNPNEAELHRNLGVIHLLQGDFSRGWQEYRWRWQVGDLQRPLNTTPIWDGSSLAGKRILLSAEQGLGDTVHFVRFARLLRQHGAQTTVYCQPQLLALLQSAPDIGQVLPNTLPLDGTYDWQCSLVDVADFLQIAADTIPHASSLGESQPVNNSRFGAQPGYIRAASHLRNYWAQRLPPSDNSIRIGIAWQGNPDHQADVYRSFPLACFQPVAKLPDVQLFSLQAGHGIEQLSQWRGTKPIHQFGEGLDQSSGGFMDTAAIMTHLDLVITSDTSIAHVAGALGVPTWLALGYIPDWRWMLNREDTPWYPSMRLFRQPRIGDWQTVFDSICQTLFQHLNSNV